MPETDGVDDALRTTTQTLAALLARRAQQRAIRREHQARQRQFDLERANARLTAEHALQSVRAPQFMITHGIGPDAPRQQITKQEALDRINWTEEDRHDFDGHLIRGSQADIRSWIGLDGQVDAAIAERYPHLMTDQQRAAVRETELARDPSSWLLSVGDRDIPIAKQTALDVIKQPKLAAFQQTSITSWVGRDPEIDQAIVEHHPNLMIEPQLAAHRNGKRRLAEMLQVVRDVAKLDERKSEDLDKVRELVGVDTLLDQAIYQQLPEVLPDKAKRAQLVAELYPAEPLFVATHRTQDGFCERTFTKQQAQERIEKSAAMLAPGGYFEQQQQTRGVAGQADRSRFVSDRLIEFREWVGQDPDIDRLLHEAFPECLNDRQIAQLKVFEGEHHYPAEPQFTIGRDRMFPTMLAEPDAIGIIERRVTTLRYLEPGSARDQLTDEIRDMIGQSPKVDQVINVHFPELLDPAARANMRLAGVGEQLSVEAPPAETIERMRQAEARSLYPQDHALSEDERAHVRELLDQLAATPEQMKIGGSDPLRTGRSHIVVNQEYINAQFDLRKYAGRELETDQLINQHQPNLLGETQVSRMRAAHALLHATAEYGERDRLDIRGHENERSAEASRGKAKAAGVQAEIADAADDPERTEQLKATAATAEIQANDFELDADRDWDTAKQRAIRARQYEACGNHQAAEARKIADTTHATPPWKAITTQIKSNKTPRRRHTATGRQHSLERGR